MLKKLTTGLLAGAVALGMAGSANAAPMFDQGNGGPANVGFLVNENNFHAQTVTAGLSGQLTRIDVFLHASSSTAGSLTFSVLNNLSSSPTVLATKSFSAASVTANQFYSFDLSSDSIFATSGNSFAFSLEGGLGSFFSVAASTSPDRYSGGANYYKAPNHSNSTFHNWTMSSGTRDLLFRTFVDPAVQPVDLSSTPMPEPGTLAILGLGLAGLGLAAGRKRVRA